MIAYCRRATVAAVVLALAGCASIDGGAPHGRSLGWQVPLGNGTATSYAEFDATGAPSAVGILLSARALDDLPMDSDMHRCYGRSKDGAVEAATKCELWHEYAVPLPDAAARRADIPFKWVLLNWNPHGHIPPGIYDKPHFDVHFQMVPIADIFAIEPGPCGPEGVRCDQFRIATRPLPSNYMPADYKDVEAVAPAMGNHLIDLTGDEFKGKPFTRSFIYGVYDGKMIFYEEMVTRAYLLGKPDGCDPIKQAKAVAVTGYYPSVACVRHDAASGNYAVSMERFVHRTAGPPEPPAAPK